MRDGGQRLDVLRNYGPVTRFGPAPGPVGWLAADEVLTHAPLTPGRHTLTVDVPGYRQATCTVEITDGRPARAEVHLTPN